MRYIPRIIHFIWFGKGKYPTLIQNCFESWKKQCPNYEIMLWNEENFDTNSNAFVKEAYESKKYAFVSDYVRLFVLYKYGGVYADSDCEILKPFDDLLENEHVVTGYSTDRWIPTAFLAAEKENVWIKKMLEYYCDRHFILKNGKLDLKPNNAIISEISEKELGFRPGKDFFIDYGQVKIYPRHIFHPFKTEAIQITGENMTESRKLFDVREDTICIHYSAGTWDHDSQNKVIRRLKVAYRKIMPRKVIAISENLFYKIKYWGESK